tara:strand:- start:406 stop:1041 length:636 start_codon:yes stop_codon:yes gene_type:complete
MQLGKHHCTIDEITYDREELLDFVNQHRHNIMQFGDYMQYLSPEKREFKGSDGMNAIAVQKTEGKDLLEYPVVKKYVDMFNFAQPIAPRDIDLLHYDPGYSFHPHTDHYMWCGIMFPIEPEDAGEPISFYSREGQEPERNVNYKKRGWTDDDIEYNHYYSNKHPTLFNGMIVHGVPTITKERIYLRIKVLGEKFEDVVEKLKNNNFILTSS